eukprot:2600588-Alexandrium_andersonii.AAC.1
MGRQGRERPGRATAGPPAEPPGAAGGHGRVEGPEAAERPGGATQSGPAPPGGATGGGSHDAHTPAQAAAP